MCLMVSAGTPLARHRGDVDALHGGAEPAGVHAGRGQSLVDHDLEHGQGQRPSVPGALRTHWSALAAVMRLPRLHVHERAGPARAEGVHPREVRRVRRRRLSHVSRKSAPNETRKPASVDRVGRNGVAAERRSGWRRGCAS